MDTDLATANPSARPTWWDAQEHRAGAALPAALLVVATAIAVIVDHGHPDTLSADLGLSVGAALILAVMFRLRAPTEDWPTVRPVIFAALIVVMAAMVMVDPIYGFFAWTGYLQVFSVLRGSWRIPGLFAVAMVVTSSQVGGWPAQGTAPLYLYLLLLAVNAGVAGGMTWFAWKGAEQNHRRALLVDELTDANRRLSETLAENAALHQQLLLQARENGVIDERHRMAREIHDTLAQGLIGIITQLQATENARPGDGRWQAHVDAAVSLARESLSEARRSVQALRPEALDSGRLPDAVADVATQWSQRHVVAVEFRVTGDVAALAPEVEVTLLRTVQEALANVAKHAGAQRVGITLSYLDDVVTLDVRDDGIGFDRAILEQRSTDGSGFGLTSIAQRVAAQCGTLETESEPGEGTAISVSMPIVPTPIPTPTPPPGQVGSPGAVESSADAGLAPRLASPAR